MEQRESAERKELVAALGKLKKVVASASFEPTYRTAGGVVAPAAPSFRDHQKYLAAFPHPVKPGDTPGIGVDALPDTIDGRGCGFADLDAGGNLRHEALVHLGDPLILPRAYSAPPNNHATAVLGIIAGRAKIRGIAPGASLKARLFGVHGKSIAETIFDLLAEPGPGGDLFKFGDILLIELAGDVAEHDIQDLPLEISPPDFRAIQWAVSLGIPVIAVAGNGHRVNGQMEGWDLDDVAAHAEWAPAWQRPPRTGIKGLLDRVFPWIHPRSPIPDSGAILVSGCRSVAQSDGAGPFVQADEEYNYGSRVDCYGWGKGVMTIGANLPPKPTNVPPPADENEWYDQAFVGTSAAAAMVTGVALLVQQMARELMGFPLGPLQLRAVLTHAGAGTPVRRDGKPTNRQLPNLARLHELLHNLPKLSIRAFVGDAGGSPADRAGMLLDTQSPDIFVTGKSSKHPDTAFDSPNDDADRMPTYDRPTRGKQSYIYVRLRNRGDGPARNVRVTAYWARHDTNASEYVAWHELPTLEAETIHSGSDFTIVGPIIWEVGRRTSGTIDLLVAAGGELDPRPSLPPVRDGKRKGLSRADLLEFVQRSTNVAMRTFDLASADGE